MTPAATLPDYAELHCISCFSFLRGASQPGELVARAAQLGYRALALTDECSVAGVVQAWQAVRELPADSRLQLIVGSEFALACGLRLVLLAQDREGYGNLCALITLARRRCAKGQYRLQRGDLAAISPSGAVPGCLALWIPNPAADPVLAAEEGRWLAVRFPDRVWLAVELAAGADDGALLRQMAWLGAESGLPLVAAGNVHMHARGRRALQDTLTAIRLRTTVADAGAALHPNGERHLRHRLRLARMHPPALLAETLILAARCRFCPDELRYEYPDEIVPTGHTAQSYLRQEVERGLALRYPQGVPAMVRAGAEKELVLIAELHYEHFFLTVYDIVRFAQGAGILHQGRGSAANSTVCYALGITAVDPTRASLLFERFISRERDEPPDIDVDFEHQRREEVIQYIYGKYGRERAALAATVIRYRTRSALRDVGVALGFGRAEIDALTRSLAWWDKREELPARLAAIGLAADSPAVARWLALAEMLRGFPRHLSQHVGGFVISRGPLARLVPVENAAMPNRSVIQWDKDDLEALGLLKVDVLALGMLSALRRSLALLPALADGRAWSLSDIPGKDAATFEMICRADTVGVFQIESRAQMSMLPRLQPRHFYDLVVQVAIVRPGPIQGGMVHPFLKGHAERKPVQRISPEIDAILARTWGVPIFQEQVMQLAVAAAGFTPGEADQLRRAMASWKQKGHVERFKGKLRAGMHQRGLDEFAEALCRQIEGFGEYGFPESHAASFALLAYDSAWVKRHHPAAFLVGLLDSQPMGFYSPSQLIQDARRHGVEVLPVDIRHSALGASLEGPTGNAVRLGFASVRGLARDAAERIVAARGDAPFVDVADLAARACLDAGSLRRLAAADTLRALAGHRHAAAWVACAPQVQGDLLAGLAPAETPPALAPPREGEDILADYRGTGFSLRRHPLALLRPRLDRGRFECAEAIAGRADRAPGRAAGLVTCRQKPGTAKSVFVTLEDETGMVNVIVHPWLARRQRRELLGARLLGVYGQIQAAEGVVQVIAKRLVDLSPLLGELPTASRDFH